MTHGRPLRWIAAKDKDIRPQATRAGCVDILARERETFQIWGVVAQVIKSMPV